MMNALIIIALIVSFVCAVVVVSAIVAGAWSDQHDD